MEDFLDFSRQDDAQSSLRLYIHSCDIASRDSHQWKSIVMSIHNALQGFVVAALKGSNGFDTWKKADLNKWLKAYESKNALPWPQLDHFMTLFDRLFSDCTNDQRWRVEWLNTQRNQFIHFNTGSYSFHLSTGISCCEEALKFIELCPTKSSGIFFYKETDSSNFYASLEEAKIATKNLAKTLNNPVQPTVEAATD